MRETFALVISALLAQSAPVTKAPATAYETNAPRSGRHWTALIPAELNAGEDGWGESGVNLVPEPFNRLVASLNVRVPAGGKCELQLCVRGKAGWSKWIPMLRAEGSPEGTRYSSAKDEGDAVAKPEVDVLRLLESIPSNAFRVRLRASGGATVRTIGVSYWRDESVKAPKNEKSAAWGVTLD